MIWFGSRVSEALEVLPCLRQRVGTFCLGHMRGYPAPCCFSGGAPGGLLGAITLLELWRSIGRALTSFVFVGLEVGICQPAMLVGVGAWFCLLLVCLYSGLVFDEQAV